MCMFMVIFSAVLELCRLKQCIHMKSGNGSKHEDRRNHLNQISVIRRVLKGRIDREIFHLLPFEFPRNGTILKPPTYL